MRMIREVVIVFQILASSLDLPVASSNLCSTLHLLNVLPMHNTTKMVSDHPWERGLEIIPAGHLAASQINSNSELLNGSTLEIIDVPSELCKSMSYDSFVEVIKLSTSQLKCLFGVVGLSCSNVARSIGEALNHPNLGYIQFSSATSPYLQNTKLYPYLFRVIASNEIYVEAAVKVMLHFNWTRASVVYNFTDIMLRRTGQAFSEVGSLSNIKVLAAISLPTNSQTEIDRIFDKFTEMTSRISFWSVSSDDIGIIICEIYKRKLLWPQYAYIFADRSLKDVLAYNGSCSPEEMKLAVEGVFFLQMRMSVSSDTVLVSGQTFREYKDEYRSALKRMEENTGQSLQENGYANTLYDQVWSFAMAMNISMMHINIKINDTFSNVVSENMANRRTLRSALLKVSFQGASGTISFDADQEVPTDISVFQVWNGAMVAIGTFITKNKTLTIFENVSIGLIPNDSFEKVIFSIPSSVTVVMITVQVFLFVLVLTSVIAVTYWRHSAEVKSTSLQLSYLMLLGAFLLSLSPLIYTLIDYLEIPSIVYSVFCNVEVWIFFLGVNIIVITLLFRLLRIVHVFRSYKRTEKYCCNTYLTMYITLTCIICVLILTVWVAVDPQFQDTSTEPQPNENPPQFLEYRYCSSRWLGVWLGLSYAWISFLLVIVICLALLTRKIKRKNFKDTKKVTFFAVGIFVTCASLHPISRILETTNSVLTAFLLRNASHIIIIILSQVLLFLPKYIPFILSRPTKTDVANQASSVIKKVKRNARKLSIDVVNMQILVPLVLTPTRVSSNS